MPGLSMEKLRKKIAFCHDVVDAVTLLEPGISTQKGLTLYELWFGEQELASRLKAEGKLKGEEYKKKLKEALGYLEESAM